MPEVCSAVYRTVHFKEVFFMRVGHKPISVCRDIAISFNWYCVQIVIPPCVLLQPTLYHLFLQTIDLIYSFEHPFRTQFTVI